jgi:hypothetical protein
MTDDEIRDAPKDADMRDFDAERWRSADRAEN